MIIQEVRPFLRNLGCLVFFTSADDEKKIAKKFEVLRKKMIPHLSLVEQDAELEFELNAPVKKETHLSPKLSLSIL